jgi:hypothetical protein
VTTLSVDLLRLLNSHFSIGILDKIGTPDPLSDFCVRSIPPSTIISSFLARTIDSNLLVEVGGGALVGGVPTKSVIFTLIPKVI